MNPESLLNHIDIILGLVAILGVAKSAWKGMLKNAYVAARDIPEIHDTVREIPSMKDELRATNRHHEQIEEDVEVMKDALIALASALDDDNAEVDPEAFIQKFSDDRSGDFMRWRADGGEVRVSDEGENESGERNSDS